ncbi:MAG: transporter [Deltaproteobacteria bacterium]|nr:transporter [Deltaproteobacteria bacterium]
MIFRVFMMLAMLCLTAATGFAEEKKVNKIEDNSFLLEEAYNQEAGVIQHIQSFQYNARNKSWAYTFVQEWPVPGQTHQFSYNIPVFRLTEDGDRTGLGDVQLNYRYQLVMKEDLVAVAPRLSLLLPTGNYRKDFGRGNPGFQTNIPMSLTLSEKFVTHWNAGLTAVPWARGANGGTAHTVDFNAGASIIWLLQESFNLMFETAWNTNTPVTPDGAAFREHSLFLNPGFRSALNFENGLQVVYGLSFPIGVGPSRGDYGVLFYLSFEHPLPALYGKKAMENAPSFTTKTEESES